MTPKPATSAKTTAKAATKAAKKSTKTATKAKAKTKTKSTTKTTAKKTTRATPLAIDAVMTPNPWTVHPDADVGEAAMLLWKGDCGALPVVGSEGDVVGMITDRDICMALTMSGARAQDRRVAEVMTSPVVACRPNQDVREALETMAKHRVRRLPVTDPKGRLAGVVSLADLTRAAGAAPTATELVDGFRQVLRPHDAKKSSR